MRENKILKVVSYIFLLILISVLILSIFIISVKENNIYDEEKYFSSREFVEQYMYTLDIQTDNLIHDNNIYNYVKDGEIKICYDNQPVSIFDYPIPKDMYYLIIYQNIAITNVELTNTTNTIESIKSYIKSNENAQTVDILDGTIQSESEIIQKIGIQYLNNINEIYYTRTINGIEYLSAEVKDFEIYSSYVEEFDENSEAAIKFNLMQTLIKYEDYTYFIIPISSALIVLILVYLVISIGHHKGSKGILVNDFDKIWLEIIIIIAIIIGIIPVIILEGINDNYKAIASLIVTSYFIIYILCAICFNTIIKRIKAKTLLKTSIIGNILLLIANCLEKIYGKYKTVYNTITYSTSVSMKVFLYFGIVIPTAIAILIGSQDMFTTILLEFILMSFVAYKVIKTSKGLSKIEKKLKEMYEGNNQNTLKKEEFGKEFYSMVKYLNDISNGFENAIQDRMKSERLKAELITNVSHDIKTPLTSIINYVDLLKKEDIQNEKAKEYIGILDNKSQRLKKLTEDLVEASKVSTGNISLNLEKINIVELIKQASGEFEDKFRTRGLDIIIDCQESEINIKADSKYMYRIIENLFSNISKYALDNSRVYVDIKKVQKHVIIEMKNISKERLNISADELMQRFVRGDKSRATEGSGLGISIAQNLTELQNGEFRLKLDGDLFKVELEFGII